MWITLNLANHPDFQGAFSTHQIAPSVKTDSYQSYVISARRDFAELGLNRDRKVLFTLMVGIYGGSTSSPPYPRKY
jgi:hypothetical protein